MTMVRPMVVRFGALGDMVLMTGPIRILHERFGAPVDVLGSGDWTEPLLQGQAGVGEIYLLRGRGRPYCLSPGQWGLVRALRRRGPGPTWLFDAKNDKVQSLLRRAGWRAEHLLTLDRMVDVAGEHFSDRWRRFAGLNPAKPYAIAASAASGLAAPAAYPELRVSDAARAELQQWLKQLGVTGGYILVQIGNKRTMRRGGRRRPSNTKYWPEDRWAAVLQGLRAAHPAHAILLLGVSPEATMNADILRLAAISNAHNLASQMTVQRLLALAESALGMLSVDTGPAHVAAAVDCPVLTLFDSPSKQIMYAPRGPRSAAHCVVGGSDSNPSMLPITPAVVLTAWERMSGSASESLSPRASDSQAGQTQYNDKFSIRGMSA
jgi:heptosyltransferase-2/heptosyltransferase-3